MVRYLILMEYAFLFTLLGMFQGLRKSVLNLKEKFGYLLGTIKPKKMESQLHLSQLNVILLSLNVPLVFLFLSGKNPIKFMIVLIIGGLTIKMTKSLVC